MRGISDYVAEQFKALGIRIAAHQLVDGRQRITMAFENEARFADIEVSPFASDAEIFAAARKAFNMTDDNIETTPEAPKPAEQPAPTSAALPVVELVPVVEKPKLEEPKMGGIMAKGYRPGSLKALLDGLHAEGQSIMQELAEEAVKAKQAHAKLRNVKTDLRAYRDGIMSDLGQFSNFADDGTDS